MKEKAEAVRPRARAQARTRIAEACSNGLSHEENAILFETQNKTEGIYYILKGLTTR